MGNFCCGADGCLKASNAKGTHKNKESNEKNEEKSIIDIENNVNFQQDNEFNIPNRNNQLNIKESDSNNFKDNFEQNENTYLENEKILEKMAQELILKKNILPKKYEPKDPIIVGLDNIDAPFYMNATLQCLSNSEDLTDYFLNKYEINPNKKLANKYNEVIINLWNKENNNKSYKPNSFKEVLSKLNPLFEGVNLIESKDLIKFLLDELHEELNVITNIYNINNDNEVDLDQTNESLVLKLFIDEFKQKFNSPISDLFFGIIELKSKCLSCNIITFNFKVYSLLDFPLEKVNKYFVNKGKKPLLTNDGRNPDIDLYECFEFYAKEELMSGENQLYCNNCKQIANAYNSTTIFLSPIYLIINLNRGKENIYECKVNFPEKLNLSNYVTFKKGFIEYDLYAVICNLGPNSKDGHFVAYCRNRLDNKWYLYDDANVTECSRKDQYNEGMPYILFYKASSSSY